ncbi:hypothetical protein FRC15_011714 [Serendipita sp. 397]|nr:hypothetical protein FRC15_011714 [Serendipita sp. 397]
MSTVQDTQQKQKQDTKTKTKIKTKSKSKTDTDIDTNDEKKERASIVELVKRKLKKKKKQKKQQQEEEKVETASASVNVPTGSGSSEATTPVPITNASQADQAITTTSNIVSDDVSTEPTHLSTPGAITTTTTPIPVTTKNAPPDNQATIDEDEDIVFPDFKSHAKDSEKFEKALEMLTHFFGITKDVSEATPILAPLKAACGVTLRAIEITKGAHNISVGWAELCEDLRPHVQMLQNHRRDIEKGRQAIDGRYVAALHHYLSIVKLIIDQAHLHAPKNEKVGFFQKFVRTAAVQTGKEEIDRYRQRLTSAWRLYNDALGGDMLRKVDDVNNNVQRMIRNQARTRRLGPYQDDSNQRDLRDIVTDILSDESLDHLLQFGALFRQLVFEPLQRLPGTRPVYIIIDGLDHSTTKLQRRELLDTLIRLLPSVKHVKVFLTSLPLQDISDILIDPQLDPQLVCGSEMQLLDIHATSHPDLEAYVESRLKNIRLVTKEHRKMIIAKADGHFLYAATVCRMLKGSRRIHDQLKVISAAKAPPEIEEKTDELYTSVLQQIDIEHGEGDEGKPIMDVLSMVIVAFQPLSIDSISTFLSNNDQVDEIVKDLSGVLKTADSTHLVKIIHPTFRDFLLSDQNRAGIHFVDARSSHARMAIACLEALESALKYDVLHVEKADKLSPRNADILNYDMPVLIGHTMLRRLKSPLHFGRQSWNF